MNSRIRLGARRGFALVTVVIVAAILAVSAMMLTMTLAAETQITKTDALFKTALNVAEEGANTALSSIRTQTTIPGSSTAWVQAIDAQVQQVLAHAVPTPAMYLGEAVHGSVRGAYQVQITVLGAPAPQWESKTTHPSATFTKVTDFGTATVRVAVTGAAYPPSVSTMISGTTLSGGYSARRAVQTTTLISYTVETLTGHTAATVIPDTFPLDMAILTGGSVSIAGAAKEFHGSVYANGDVYVQKSSGITGGYAYAAGSATGNVPAGSKSGMTKRDLPDPSASLPFYQAMYYAYLHGQAPYDGSDSRYTDTRQLLSNGTTNPNYVKYHIAALLASPTATQYFTDPTAIYYVDAGSGLHLNGGNLSGTIVVKGNIFINGNITVAAGSSLPAIIATGNVTKDNGCSYVKGVIVAGGTFTGRGTADIYGAIISSDSVDLKGNFTVTYDPTLTSFTGGGTVVPGGDYPGTPTYTLNDLAVPAAGDRTWQEVNPS
jgi:cytoskeletal protein CcmA (bactofilin family)/type II secretory pathway pseudopilin PulG